MTHKKSKIASIELQDDFDISRYQKREYFILHIKNVSKETQLKFHQLKNHFVTCEIYHQKLVYIGHVSIRDMTEYYEETGVQNIAITVCFEA